MKNNNDGGCARSVIVFILLGAVALGIIGGFGAFGYAAGGGAPPEVDVLSPENHAYAEENAVAVSGNNNQVSASTGNGASSVAIQGDGNSVEQTSSASTPGESDEDVAFVLLIGAMGAIVLGVGYLVYMVVGDGSLSRWS